MCGRFALFSDMQAIMKYADSLAHGYVWNSHYNVSPSMDIPLLKRDNESIRLSSAKWGFIPHFAGKNASAAGSFKLHVINAKAETIGEKAMFRYAFQYSRCLIPANGFYEWRAGDKQPFLLTLPDQSLFCFAGICSFREESELDTCAIITTSANTLVEHVHKRMPVILADDALHRYLFGNDLNKIKQLLLPYPSEKMSIRAVSKEVGNTRNNYPALID